MKSFRHHIFVYGVFFVILLGGILVFGFGQYNNYKRKPMQAAETITIPKIKEIVDEKSGISFKVPPNFFIENDNLWSAVGRSTDNLVYWWVFDTDYWQGTLEERCLAFGNARNAADGIDGSGSGAKTEIIETLFAKSNDTALIAAIQGTYRDATKKWDGPILGYMLCVDLKPVKSKFRHFFLFTPKKEVLLDVLKTVNIPKGISVEKK